MIIIISGLSEQIYNEVERLKIRLDKYLADMSIGTRTEVKRLICKGAVRVNTQVVKKPELKIDIESDKVYVGENAVC